MDHRELAYTITTDSSPKIAVQIQHLPTGLCVSGEGVLMIKLREKLLKKLKEKIKDE